MVEKFKSPKDVTTAMEDITKTLVQLIVFYFFAAQFLYAFGASNMGALIAIAGAEFLKSLALPPQVTIFGIIIFVAMLNLIITSASAKSGDSGTYLRTDADGCRYCAGADSGCLPRK